MKIRSVYGEEKTGTPVVFKGKGRAKQAFKDECNINNIMRKFEKTGVLPEMIKTNPQYGDFSSVPDYLTALNVVAKAHDQFDSLSAKVRDRFHNDPEKFLAFATDPKNGKEMVELGLAVARQPEPVKQQPRVEPVTPPSPAVPKAKDA